LKKRKKETINVNLLYNSIKNRLFSYQNSTILSIEDEEKLFIQLDDNNCIELKKFVTYLEGIIQNEIHDIQKYKYIKGLIDILSIGNKIKKSKNSQQILITRWIDNYKLNITNHYIKNTSELYLDEDQLLDRTIGCALRFCTEPLVEDMRVKATVKGNLMNPVRIGKRDYPITNQARGIGIYQLSIKNVLQKLKGVQIADIHKTILKQVLRGIKTEYIITPQLQDNILSIQENDRGAAARAILDAFEAAGIELSDEDRQYLEGLAEEYEKMEKVEVTTNGVAENKIKAGGGEAKMEKNNLNYVLSPLRKNVKLSSVKRRNKSKESTGTVALMKKHKLSLNEAKVISYLIKKEAFDFSEAKVFYKSINKKKTPKIGGKKSKVKKSKNTNKKIKKVGGDSCSYGQLNKSKKIKKGAGPVTLMKKHKIPLNEAKVVSYLVSSEDFSVNDARVFYKTL